MKDDCLDARGNCKKCDRRSMCFPTKDEQRELNKTYNDIIKNTIFNDDNEPSTTVLVPPTDEHEEKMTNEEALEFGKFWIKINSDAKGTSTYQFTEIAVRLLENQISIIKELEDIKSIMTKELTETPLDEKDFAVDKCLEKYIQLLSERVKRVGGDIDEDL